MYLYYTAIVIFVNIHPGIFLILEVFHNFPPAFLYRVPENRQKKKTTSSKEFLFQKHDFPVIPLLSVRISSDPGNKFLNKNQSCSHRRGLILICCRLKKRHIFQIGIQLSDLLSQLLHVIINVLSQISAYDQIIVKRHNQVMDRQRQMIQVYL